MWWLERPDGTVVDLALEGRSRNDVTDAWLRDPAHRAGVNRSVLKRQIRACTSGLAEQDWVRARYGDAVVRAARTDVERPLQADDLLAGLAGLVDELAGPLARYSVHSGRLIFERHLCPDGLPTAVRHEFENMLRDRLATAVREYLLGQGADLDIGGLVEGVVAPALVDAARAAVGDRVRTFAETEIAEDSRELLVALALELKPDAAAAVAARDVVPQSEQERLWHLVENAYREVGRGPLWTWWPRTDAELVIQEAALRTHQSALAITAAGTTVRTLNGLFALTIGRVQGEQFKVYRRRRERETLTDDTSTGGFADPEALRWGVAPGALDEAWTHLRSGEQRAILAEIAGELEAIGTWEARCAAVIVRNPDADEIQAALLDLSAWLGERVSGWPPVNGPRVITDGPAAAAAEILRLLLEAMLAEPRLWAALGIAPGEPL